MKIKWNKLCSVRNEKKIWFEAWTNQVYRHQSKMPSSNKIDLLRDFAAGVYQSLQTGDTVSHVGIFDPAF